MRAILLISTLAAAILAPPVFSGPSGLWSGSIQVPNQELEVQITIVEKPAWSGKINIFAQGVKNFPLQVAVEGPLVTLRMAGISGDPCFRGTWQDDNLSGTFNQSGQTFPFRLMRALPSIAPTGVTERAVQIGQKPWLLPGTLSLPGGKSPFPAVVLIHGSGANDQDERVGACVLFRDLAWGLAQRGVAVLRYDKRTFVYGQACAALSNLTVREECLDDAVMAVALAAKQPEIGRVFLLGHSLGGYLLPRLAKATPVCVGYISLAGSARPTETLILEQIKRQGAPANLIAGTESEIQRIRNLNPAKPEAGLILNAPASYDLRGFDPAREALAVHKPMFFLQGDQDCQVTLEDFQLWKASLNNRTDVSWKRYPKLNHLFVAVEGLSTGAEYAKGGHVDAEVLDDLAAWIKERSPDRN